VNAFRATLEELDDASLLLHVVDASDPAHDAQVEAVEQILETLGLLSKPRFLVWNKADRVDPELARTLVQTRGGVAISAATGDGLQALLHKADRTLFAEGTSVELGALVTPLRLRAPDDAEPANVALSPDLAAAGR
jgi:GTP-binding protein HflX